jgi:hypothetical protein
MINNFPKKPTWNSHKYDSSRSNSNTSTKAGLGNDLEGQVYKKHKKDLTNDSSTKDNEENYKYFLGTSYTPSTLNNSLFTQDTTKLSIFDDFKSHFYLEENKNNIQLFDLSPLPNNKTKPLSQNHNPKYTETPQETIKFNPLNSILQNINTHDEFKIPPPKYNYFELKNRSQYYKDYTNNIGDYNETSKANKEINDKAAQVRRSINLAATQSQSTHDLAQRLQKIRERFELKNISMVSLGTDDAGVEYQINPWFFHKIPSSSKILYKMEGTQNNGSVSNVYWQAEELKIGSAKATVGTHMIATKLASDFELGSDSGHDKNQNKLMNKLVGNKNQSNENKYIKGHLLNNNVGGPGKDFNLFPITSDANRKHLVYVEKYIKSQINNNNVVYYEVKVDHKPPVQHGSKYSIDANLEFLWYPLDVHGNPYKTKHRGKIESRYSIKGQEPFDIKPEYKGQYNNVDTSVITPNTIQNSQHMKLFYNGPPKKPMSIPNAQQNLVMAQSQLGAGAANSTQLPNSYNVKTDNQGSYISTRPMTHALSQGDYITFIEKQAGVPMTVKITKTDVVGGGWTSIYF